MKDEIPNLTKTLLKMLRGAWLLIVLWVVGWAVLLLIVGHFLKPYADAILRKLQQ